MGNTYQKIVEEKFKPNIQELPNLNALVEKIIEENESSIMKLATSLYSKIVISLSLSKSVISFENRLEAVRLSSQG
nr:hypothetical protein M8286_01860 [Streptococcus suis]